MTKPNKTMYCSECGNDDIEWRVWADEHDIVKSGGLDNNEVWCEDCEERTECELKEESEGK